MFLTFHWPIILFDPIQYSPFVDPVNMCRQVTDIHLRILLLPVINIEYWNVEISLKYCWKWLIKEIKEIKEVNLAWRIPWSVTVGVFLVETVVPVNLNWVSKFSSMKFWLYLYLCCLLEISIPCSKFYGNNIAVYVFVFLCVFALCLILCLCFLYVWFCVCVFSCFFVLVA